MENNQSNETNKEPIPVGQSGVEFTSLGQMWRAAKLIYDSGLCPSSFQNPNQIVVCWMQALEMGLKPMQALQGMSVVNGKVGIGGDLALALVEASGLLESKKTEYSGSGDDLTCTVTIKRKDKDPASQSFSVKEARHAGLLDRKSSPWNGYPRRMTYYRALGFVLRDEFSDVMKGIKTTEELADYPEKEVRGRVIEPTPLPKADPEPLVEYGPPAPPFLPEAEKGADVTSNCQINDKSPGNNTLIESVSGPESKKNGFRSPLEEVRRLAAAAKFSNQSILKVLHSMKLTAAEDLSLVSDNILELVIQNFDMVRSISLTLIK